MNPFQAVHQGIRVLGKNRRMCFVFWFYNTVFALVLVLPLAAMLARDLGHSAYAAQMLGNFDLQWLSEFVVKSGGWPLMTMTPLAITVAAGYFVLSTFLYGGALTVLSGPERGYRPGLFYEGCGRNFGRLVRLLLLSGVFYAAILLINSMLRGVARGLWEDSMEARPGVFFGWFRAGLMLVLFLLVNMIFDYAKIRLVAEDSRGAVRAGLGSFALVARNFGKCAGTYAIVAGLFVAFSLIYAALSGLLPRENVWGLVIVVLVQQAYILSRIWVKLLFLSSQVEMYGSLRPAAPGEAVAAPLELEEVRSEETPL